MINVFFGASRIFYIHQRIVCYLKLPIFRAQLPLNESKEKYDRSLYCYRILNFLESVEFRGDGYVQKHL